MLFYDSIGPNPKVVRMFMAERGISGIPSETIDLRGGENRREPYLSRQSGRQTCPALALDNGTVLAEITAICEYLDEIGPAGTTLIGKTPRNARKPACGPAASTLISWSRWRTGSVTPTV